MKCLVTGATGFVGTNLVHELVEAGWKVRATGLHGDTKHIAHLPIEIKMADITIPEEVNEIVKGCDIVFHMAGDTSFWKHYFDRQRRVNVNGTVNIAKACLQNGVKRMVYTSTIDVLGYDPAGEAITEETGKFNFDNMGYNYGETKLKALEKIHNFIQQGLDTVIIYPGFMMGPYDHTLQLGRLFFDMKNGKLPFLIPGGSSFCHVTEVAKAHIVASEQGQTGEGYICAGNSHTNIPHAILWQKMADAINVKPPKTTIPRMIFILYAYMCQITSELTKKPPQIDPGQARQMTCHQYALSSKAVKDLGYHIPDIDTCIEDALVWYRNNGYDL